MTQQPDASATSSARSPRKATGAGDLGNCAGAISARDLAMMQVVGNESRIHPRLKLDTLADVIGTQVVLAKPLDDISVGGCRFAGPAWEPVGTELQLVLGFPSTGAAVPIEGLVVRASTRDMGVRFHQMSDEQKWALRKRIREVQRRS